ncbi:MAG: KpsF/GutQ family sugar-phosphate isomerase [Gammaproteobacteria bacterium]|nr:KpsF/GutQ family sugar-phosphate isomerase [Gammaproteobacteria bacterium]
MKVFNPTLLLQRAVQLLEDEAAAISAIAEGLQERQASLFIHACELILACRGRVVVTGMGKSGHIGGKIAATLASTGTPAFFVHPGEASHGDLGMIIGEDLLLMLSNSGETEELLTILPLIKRLNIPLIAITARPQSRLARAATVHLDIGVNREACPLGLAPTTSTTATLALGDALAVALLEARDFTEADFARSHPAGSLGRRLLLRIEDLMHSGEQLPQVAESVSLSTALAEMSRKGLGMTNITNAAGEIVGIFTDGDLRRLLDHGEVAIAKLTVSEVMRRHFTTITPGQLAADALPLMEQRRINALPVVETQQRLIGTLNMHDLLRAGIV